MEGVEQLKYLGRTQDQTYGDWLDVRQNFKWAWKFWGRMGKIMRREGAYTKVAALFYRVVVQAVILSGLESWVMATSMEKMVEGAHTRLL